MRTRLRPLLVASLLLIPLLLANLDGLRSYFVGDDFDFLVRMRRLDGPLDALRMTFWGEWEPAWYLGFYRDWRIWGDQAFGYHLANFAWMAIGVLALFAIIRRLLPDTRLAPWAAALAFAAHPLHDEAVTYIAARGHTMAAGLSLVGMLVYLHARDRTRGLSRLGWWLAALLAMFAAMSAKETALVLPVWIGWIEWGVFGGARLRASSLLPAVRRTLLVLTPALGYLALRLALVGGSKKLKGPSDGVWEIFTSFSRYAPDYSLMGVLPFPFAFEGRETLARFRLLGWIALAVWFVPPLVLLVRRWARQRAIGPRLATYMLGLGVAVSGLLPVFWADLGLKRRYFFVPSIGLAICAGIIFERLHDRQRKLAVTLCVLLSLVGFVGLARRNELYREAGEVTRSLVEAARRDAAQGPLTEVGLVTLPRFLGGDGLSGAYLLHTSDAVSAMVYGGLRFKRLSIGSEAYFADDYRAELSTLDAARASLKVQFESDEAFRASRDYDPRSDRRGRMVRMEKGVDDERDRSITFPVGIPWHLGSKPHLALYVYSDGRFRRWPEREAAAEMQQADSADETKSDTGR